LAVGEGGAARPLILLQPEDPPALLVLPAIPTAGIDLIEADLSVLLGDAEALEAALWIQPPWRPLAAIDDLTLLLPGTRCTSWRQADAARGVLRLALRLPEEASPSGMISLALALRHRGARGGEAAPLHVEWTDAIGRRLDISLPPAARPTGPAPSPSFAAAAPEGMAPRIEPGGGVRLHELFVMEGGGYRHLDIVVDGLRLGTLAWPRLRFKFAVNGGAPQIEIRSRPDWPVLFERWPGTLADEHGPYFLLTEPSGDGRAASRLRTERDRRLLQSLLRLLPTLVASAARAGTVDPGEYADWVALARRFAAALLDGPSAAADEG
jgi:hypothetical protein